MPIMTTDTRQLYTIRLEGHLGSHWAEWFDGMSICHEDGPFGETVLTGYVVDQAALHGLLCKIRDLGLPLIAIQRITASEQTLVIKQE